jgi:hypothetical protein
MVLRNFGVLPQNNTASQPRGPRFESLSIASNIQRIFDKENTSLSLILGLVLHVVFNFGVPYFQTKSHDSSVGITLGYGLDDRDSRVQFPTEAGNFFLHHRVKNVSGAHPASYPMGTRGSFPGGKAAGA